MGPTCPTCGSQLTWYPQQNAWGCDRCRVMQPAQPLQMAAVQLPAPPPGPSKLPYLIAAIATVVVAAVAIVIVLRRAAHAGLDRDSVVRSTFALLARGDAETLVARSAPVALASVVACTTETGEERRAFEEQARRDASRLDGAKLEVGTIREAGTAKTFAKDAELTPGCKLTKPLTLHELTVGVGVTTAAGHEDATATLTAVEVGGSWYVATLPRIDGCSAAVDDLARAVAQQTGPNVANRAQKTFLAACQKSAWSAIVTKCLEGASGASSARGCMTGLPGEELTALRDDKALAPLRDAALPDPNAKPTGAPSTVMAAAQAPIPTSSIKIDDTLIPDVAPAEAAGTDRGEPEQGQYADFWLAQRSSGGYHVFAPYVSAVFPGKPEQRFDPARSTYTFYYDLQDDGSLRLDVTSLGRNATLPAGDDPLVQTVASIGPVRRRKREFKGVTYIDLEAKEAVSGGSLRTLQIQDLAKGLLITAVVSTSANKRALGTQFLATVEERFPDDPATDPETLADMRSDKTGKKYVVTGPNFRAELPWPVTIARATNKVGVTSTISSEKGESSITINLIQVGAWDGLQNTPAQQRAAADEVAKQLKAQTGGDFSISPFEYAGMPGFEIESTSGTPRVQARTLWSRYLHRALVITCTDAPCDATVRSIEMPAYSMQ